VTEDDDVEKIVIEHSVAARVLAILPAAVVALAVRALTVVNSAVAARAAAAGVVAVSCWWVYRLLTARLVVAESGVHVRGVLYEADIPWTELEHVSVAPSGQVLQFLLLGIMRPHSLALRSGARTLRPIAAVNGGNDDEISRAVRMIRTRVGVWRVPTQREPDESVTTV
jgi:hypothetical protein